MTRILVIDDHAVVRRGLEQILAEALPDARFGEASSSAEALALVEAQQWDLAVVDLNLPGRDGLALLSDLKSVRPRLPALVVSAYPEEEFAVRCLKLGASGYVTKSSAADELAGAAKKVLGGGRYVTLALAEKLAERLGGDLSPSHEALSNRELQVLRLVARGRSGKEIAAELALSEKTIATYRARLVGKLHISSNVELARYALRHHLVE